MGARQGGARLGTSALGREPTAPRPCARVSHGLSHAAHKVSRWARAARTTLRWRGTVPVPQDQLPATCKPARRPYKTSQHRSVRQQLQKCALRTSPGQARGRAVQRAIARDLARRNVTSGTAFKWASYSAFSTTGEDRRCQHAGSLSAAAWPGCWLRGAESRQTWNFAK